VDTCELQPQGPMFRFDAASFAQLIHRPWREFVSGTLPARSCSRSLTWALSNLPRGVQHVRQEGRPLLSSKRHGRVEMVGHLERPLEAASAAFRRHFRRARHCRPWVLPRATRTIARSRLRTPL
jgi:hypothetical protein